MSSDFSFLVRGYGVAIYGGTVRILRPYLGARSLVLAERVLWLCDWAKGCPYVVVLVRYDGSGSPINDVGTNAVRRVIARRARDRLSARVAIGKFYRGSMYSCFVLARRCSIFY